MAQPSSTPAFSQAAYELASRYRLGNLVAEYRPWLRRRSMLLTGAYLLGGGLFLLILGVRSLDASGPIVLLFAVALIVLAFVRPALYFFSTRHLRVYVGTLGLVRVKKNQIEAVTWDQVEAFWQNVTRITYRVYGVTTNRVSTHKYTIRRADGTRMVFRDTLLDVENLGNTIAQETARLLLPRAIDTYNSGASVVFGPLSVSKQGITKSTKHLPWDQFAGVQVENGTIKIRQRGQRGAWASVEVSTLPNFLVFMNLLSRVQPTQQHPFGDMMRAFFGEQATKNLGPTPSQ
jgi:hypothetical protein